jgi:oxygen-independent coproporphyrinogen-3 oxidase
MARLADLERDGLVELAPEWIGVTLKGRPLIRNVCMVFDRCLATRGPATHSKTVRRR